jgi:YHS domain-containing protein
MMVRDPVCGREIDERQAAGASRFNDSTRYFCSRDCKIAFDREPATYDALARRVLPGLERLPSVARWLARMIRNISPTTERSCRSSMSWVGVDATAELYRRWRQPGNHRKEQRQ